MALFGHKIVKKVKTLEPNNIVRLHLKWVLEIRFLTLDMQYELHPNWYDFSPISFYCMKFFFCNGASLRVQEYDQAQEATDTGIGINWDEDAALFR